MRCAYIPVATLIGVVSWCSAASSLLVGVPYFLVRCLALVGLVHWGALLLTLLTLCAALRSLLPGRRLRRMGPRAGSMALVAGSVFLVSCWVRG